MKALAYLFEYGRDFVKAYRHIASFRWLVVGSLVGVFAGLVAVAFFGAIELGKYLIQPNWQGSSPRIRRANSFSTRMRPSCAAGSSPLPPPPPAC
ncbi:hypothetical protein [Salidesulfovibrio brasiliensis]|uniref:hypothetical protein n=1 Tax=Salidesulfovibrio brasiliensis TaxID=221711 RepID=UPI000AA4D551